jgi:hypothetical protein
VATRLAEAATQDRMPLQAREVGGIVARGGLRTADKADPGLLDKADRGLVDKGALDPAVKAALGWVDRVVQDRVAPTQGATVARTIRRPPVRKIRRAK